MATAAGFKSLVPEVKTADEIAKCVGYPLLYEYMFEHKTSPWEMSSWNEEDLQNFQIDVDQIDRLYSVTNTQEHDMLGGDFYLLARMKHMNKDMFVELKAFCDSSGFDCHGDGSIYITSNPNIFYNTMVIGSERENILSSLLEDGYKITIQPEVNSVSSWHNPPNLLFLCHKAVRDNQHCLAHYPDVLPKPLTNSLNDFIRVKEAMDDYDE